MTRPRIADKKREFSPTGGSVKITTAADMGKAIREKRVAAGLTLQEAAPLCNVGIRFLSELERGKPGSGFGNVLHVAQVLGLQLLLVPQSEGEEI
jgi:HTH-type transcriptional regulator/antitoxin HipB